MTTLPRALGAATLAYSLAVVASPKLLAGPCRLTDEQGEVPRDVATAVRAVSTRDAIVSAAMLTVPAGTALRTATAIRAACDVSDAVVFGAVTEDPGARRKIVAVALGWGSLCWLSRRWA
ncbi:MAG: hypothetical protein WCD35_00850 [Mycobacteriales bacterium]